MQDDSPWKPPSDGGPTGDEPSLPSAAPGAPSLPEATPEAPAGEPSLPASAPAATGDAPSLPAPAPAAPAGAPSLPPSAPVVPEPAVAAPTVAPLPVNAAQFPGTPTGPMGADTVVVSSGPPPGRSRRSKWLVGGAVAAVVATGAAGAFAVANLTGSAGAGGAATPEELGLSLLQAIESEDVLGVVDVLSPGEREVFRDPLVDLVDELTRLEVLSDDADLSRIMGVDVEFENEVVSATSTNVPDITNIDLRADATITFDGADLPVGALITDNVPEDFMTQMRGTRLTETDDLDIRLTAIEEDGRWYFSVFHSIAEVARGELAPSSLIPVEGIGSDGAETPEAAFDGLLDTVEALDLTGMLRRLNPGEAAALQRYSPLFLEQAESALDEVPLDWKITRREFRVDETGDSATIFVDALAIEGVVEGDSFTVEFADGCVKASAAGETFEQCQDEAFDDSTGVFEETPEIERLIETVTEAFSDIEEVGLEMRRTDELWYVSPTDTASEAFLAVLRALDRSELDAIIEQAPAAGEEFGDVIFGGLNGLPGGIGGFDDEISLTDDELTELIVEGSDEFSADIAVDAGWQDCYSEFDPDAALACFDTAVADGDIDSSQVPVVLRFPECGYTDAWGGGIYELSDEEFVAAVEAAQPCFLDLVAQGEINDFELPPEVAYLECFEGRNWYNVFDDPEFDERYYACLETAYAG